MLAISISTVNRYALPYVTMIQPSLFSSTNLGKAKLLTVIFFFFTVESAEVENQCTRAMFHRLHPQGSVKWTLQFHHFVEHSNVKTLIQRSWLHEVCSFTAGGIQYNPHMWEHHEEHRDSCCGSLSTAVRSNIVLLPEGMNGCDKDIMSTRALPRCIYYRICFREVK